MTRVLREVRQFLERQPNAVGAGGVVGVSGGADSAALLRALHACAVPLTVAHVNHKLRGADSDADETFVRELCASLDVAYRVKSVNVAELASGENLEATAREVRYTFFAEVASEVKAKWIATAHTADDQAETVLHRLIRGTGLQGLRGIARVKRPNPLTPEEPNPLTPFPKREGGTKQVGAADALAPPSLLGKGAGGVRSGQEGTEGVGCPVLRPLLALTRADVLAYLAAINQPYREDASNLDPRFTRNRIRHELLPLLKTFNPEVVSALTHIAEHAGEAHDVLTALARELLAKAERPRAANTLILDAGTLTAAPRAVLRAALRLLWEREGWPMSAMSFEAWERAVEIASDNAPAADFPGGVSMRKVGKVVQVICKE